MSCLQVKDTRKMKLTLKSVESSEFNNVVQIDHQKICMADSGYNQILVIIDHFTKPAEEVPCQTASAKETCDHLITHWISRYGCPMKKKLQGKPYAVGKYARVIQNIISPKVTKKLLKKKSGMFMITEVHQQCQF